MMYNFKVFQFKQTEIEKKLKRLKILNNFFFYNNEWLKSFKSYNIKNHENFYVEVYYKNKILMIMFFQIKIKLSLRILNWLYMDDLNFVTPILIQEHKFNKLQFRKLIKKIFDYFKVDLVFLDKNPNIIGKSFNPLYLYENENSENILTIRTSETSWDNYYREKCNSKTRQTDRRKEKLLSQNGNLKFIVANKPKQKKEVLDFTLKNKILFLKKKGLDPERFQKIYTKLFDQIKHNPNYICSMLKLDNKIISSIFSRIENNCLYYLVPCILENNFSKYSPGRIALKKQIEWCFKNDIFKIDLGPGDFEYKKLWSNDVEYYFKILEPKSFLGNVYLLLYRLKNIFN